jgi:uncharacterized protein (TIGR03083 family)
MDYGGVTGSLDETLRQRCVESVVEEGERFGVLAQQLATGRTPAQRGLEVPVPWIPAWTARELIEHLGTVHRWATRIVRAGHADFPPRETSTLPHVEALHDWYATGLAELVATLRTTPPDAPAWHMSPTAPKVAASWCRRQAHELVVHRMDLESAAGVPHAPVDRELAADGVDELLSVILPRWAHTGPLNSADVTVGVTATDTGTSWSVAVRQGVVSIERERADDADAWLSGPAASLLLHLWGRPAAVLVEGDPAAESILRGR